MQPPGSLTAIEPSVRAPKARVEWVDYAKGICIFFVVMFHVNELAQETAGGLGWLEEVVKFARPFRMPDFFLIAGLFLANAMRRSWRHYLDVKVVHFLYFYLLWMTLEFGVRHLRHLIAAGADPLEISLVYFRRWIDPVGPLWFIHMLPVFFLLTRLTRRVPAWLMWLVLAALHSLWVGLPVQTDWHVINELGTRYVYFYSGYVLAPHVFRIAAWADTRMWGLLGYLACWAVVNGILVMEGWALWPGVSLALGFVGALAVIFAAVLLSKLSWTDSLRYLGQSSLVVYLGDFAVSFVVVRLVGRVIGDIGTFALVSTVLTVIGTMVMWRVTLWTPARFMYVRPEWLKYHPPERPPT